MPGLEPDSKRWSNAGRGKIDQVGVCNLFDHHFQLRTGAVNCEKGYIVGVGGLFSDRSIVACCEQLHCNSSLSKFVCRLYGLPWLGFPVQAKFDSEEVYRLQTSKLSRSNFKAADFDVPKGLVVCKTLESATMRRSSIDIEELVGN